MLNQMYFLNVIYYHKITIQDDQVSFKFFHTILILRLNIEKMRLLDREATGYLAILIFIYIISGIEMIRRLIYDKT